MRNKLRNILIALFIILAVYQIITLWFDNFSLYTLNFLGNSRKVSSIENMDYIIKRLIVNVGDNRIVGKANDIYTFESKSVFDEGVEEAIDKGENIDLGEFNWNDIFKSRAIIYEFGNVFTKEDIPEIFGSSIDQGKINSITDFDYVIIMPNSNGTLMNVVFYNSSSNKYSGKSLKNSSIISKVYTESTAFAAGEVSDYISSEQNGFDIFAKNVFIPGWQENGLNYALVNCLGMYKDESMAEKNAEDFFDNPAAKWSSNENNTLIYSDETTVVKFYKDNKVFEYSNYRAESDAENTFAGNYITAVNTIRQDSCIKNEIYLRSYKSEEGRYTFYFNYKINDREIIPSEDIKSSTGLSSFIEVSTEGGRLVRYRKYGYYFEKSTTENVADCDFVTAIDKVYSEEKIQNINLCYVAADNKSAIKLNWIIEAGDKVFVVSAERE